MPFRGKGGLEMFERIHLLLNPFLLDGVLLGNLRNDSLALLAVEEGGRRNAVVALETVTGQIRQVSIRVGEHLFDGREVYAVLGERNAVFGIEEADNP